MGSISRDKNRPIPIFSLPDLQKGLQQEELKSSIMDKGVFYLTETGISEEQHQQIIDVTMDFFQHGSDTAKSSLVASIPGIRRGYSKLESESTAQVTDKGTYSDYATCYSMGMEGNLFPSAEFENIWTNYFNLMHIVAKETSRQVLNAADVSWDGGIDSLLDCDPVLRVRDYPEVTEKRCAEFEPLRMAPHYDLSLITLIHQTEAPNGFVGLQCDVGGTFLDIPPIKNALVVLCGAVATLVAGGKVKSATHQIVAPPGKLRIGSSRNSSAFFLRPKSDFSFSVPYAKSCGLNITLNGETATFKDWVRGNYTNMHTNIV